MKKNIITAVAVLVVLALLGWYFTQKGGVKTVQVYPTSTATGTISAIVPESVTVTLPDGTSGTYLIKETSHLIRLKSVSTAAVGSPIVVIYSQAMNKPISAVLSNPFPTGTISGGIEVIAGTLVSANGNTLKVSVDGKEQSYVFDNPKLLLSPALILPGEVKVGDSVTVEYLKSGNDLVIQNAYFN